MTTRTARRAVFVDRDGVINRNRDDYVKSWGEFEFLPGALDGLRRLAALDARVIVITNQSIINRGLAPRAVVDDINARMTRAVSLAGGRIDAVFVCPHRPDEVCDCRKPKPGLLLQAAARFDLDLAQCILIGDNETDVRAARAAGCAPVLVRTGLGAAHEQRLRDGALGDVHVSPDLREAAEWAAGRLRA